jgi:hypothetical protein
MIEQSLAGSDSRLASLYTIFNRLAQGDAMPAIERRRTWVRHIPWRKKVRAPARAAGHWLGNRWRAFGYRASAPDRS